MGNPELLNNYKSSSSQQQQYQPQNKQHQQNNDNNLLLKHSPLHLASRNGHKQIVEILLLNGFDVNLLTINGTALHEAALCGKDSVVITLLKAGTNLDYKDCEGRTVINLLEQFPPHVTRGILSVIKSK